VVSQDAESMFATTRRRRGPTDSQRKKKTFGRIKELQPFFAKFFSRKHPQIFIETGRTRVHAGFFTGVGDHGWMEHQVDQMLLSVAINACENAQQWPLALGLLQGGGVFGCSTWGRRNSQESQESPDWFP